MHISIEEEVRLLNMEAKHHLFSLLKIVKPCLNVLVYLSHAPDTTPAMRCVTTFVALMTASVLFIETYLCSSVLKSAHRSQSTLYSCLMSKDHRIPLKTKLKFLRFIERLSGPEIGFYCHNLFAINSYNFADYVLDSMYSYFLVIKLLKRNEFI